MKTKRFYCKKTSYVFNVLFFLLFQTSVAFGISIGGLVGSSYPEMSKSASRNYASRMKGFNLVQKTQVKQKVKEVDADTDSCKNRNLQKTSGEVRKNVSNSNSHIIIVDSNGLSEDSKYLIRNMSEQEESVWDESSVHQKRKPTSVSLDKVILHGGKLGDAYQASKGLNIPVVLNPPDVVESEYKQIHPYATDEEARNFYDLMKKLKIKYDNNDYDPYVTSEQYNLYNNPDERNLPKWTTPTGFKPDAGLIKMNADAAYFPESDPASKTSHYLVSPSRIAEQRGFYINLKGEMEKLSSWNPDKGTVLIVTKLDGADVWKEVATSKVPKDAIIRGKENTDPYLRSHQKK